MDTSHRADRGYQRSWPWVLGLTALAPPQIREEIDKFGIHVYQFPECDSDEDEDFKQQDRELKVSSLGWQRREPKVSVHGAKHPDPTQWTGVFCLGNRAPSPGAGVGIVPHVPTGLCGLGPMWFMCPGALARTQRHSAG